MTRKPIPITVLMAVYNNEQFIKETVESVLNQTFGDFELLIVNDGSSDESMTLINSYDDPRIKLIENQENIGLTKSLNIGLKQAQGKYIARIDSDDVCLPERLEKQYKYLEENENCVLVGAGAEYIDAQGNKINEKKSDVGAGLLKYKLFFDNPMIHSSIFFRRKSVMAIGGYNEEFEFCQDYELYTRLVKQFEINNLAESLVKYRVHNQAISSDGRKYNERINYIDEIQFKYINTLLPLSWDDFKAFKNQQKYLESKTLQNFLAKNQVISQEEIKKIRNYFKQRQKLYLRNAMKIAAKRMVGNSNYNKLYCWYKIDIEHHNNLKQYVDLSKSQWWDIEKLKKFQDQRVKEIVNYSYEAIPGYRKLWDKNGVGINQIQAVKDLKKLPIVTREMIQNNDDFINRRLIAHRLETGGSTGSSLVYFDDDLAGRVRMASHYRGWSWFGQKSWSKVITVMGGDRIFQADNQLYVKGELVEENLKQNTEQLLSFKPFTVRGYVGSLYIWAKYLIENEIKINFIEAVNSVSENLYDYQREIIERGFNAKVYEEYCCNDGGACAWECDKSKHQLHWAMERAIIEDVDGEMVVTDLWNMAMPFIRYKNGDKVIFHKEKCSCGRTLPLINVKGRDNDMIITPKGPLAATYLMHHGIGYGGVGGNFRLGIRAIQYIQDPGYNLRVNLVKNKNCTDNELKDFEHILKRITHGMKIQINFVVDIPATKKGKRQFIINNDKCLLSQYQGNW